MLAVVRGLYDLVFRQRYGDDVLLNSISLFKKCFRSNRPAFPVDLIIATVFRLSAALLENHLPSYSELVVMCYYKFTREQLLQAE
jgi:hypothetical protein